MNEQWKPVVGYEGFYEVSDHGRVKSLPRLVKRGSSDYPVKGGILKPQRQASGHLHVQLCNSDARVVARVHRLVLAAFVGPCPEGMEVCHNDGNPTHNRLDNLRYDTRRNNVADSKKHGSFPTDFSYRKGAGNGRALLNEAQIRLLRKTARGTVKALCEAWGISQGHASKIRNKTSWSHIQ